MVGIIVKTKGETMKGRTHAERDKTTGKFLKATESPEEIRLGIEAFNEVIDIKKELKKLHILSMKYLRGTIQLDNAQANLLKEMYKQLSDKIVPNAKAGESGPAELDVVIKAPKKPKGT